MSKWETPKQINQINDGEVHIWLADLTLPAERINQCYGLLSNEERARSERFVFQIHQQRFTVSHGFMRMALASYLSLSPVELSFAKEEKGKPLLNSKNADEGLHFNLSHSNDVALLAVSKNKVVGVDVEHISDHKSWQKIIKRFFTETEQKAIFSLPENKQREAFFQVWTRKEAHMKVVGEGLYLSPSQFTVSVPPQPAAFIRYTDKPATQQWQMQDIVFQRRYEDYCACLSVEEGFSKVSQFIFA